MTVSPAYGRDYKSLKAMRADWDADRDFIIQDVHSQWDGKPVNRAQVPGVTVFGRFNQFRKIGLLQKGDRT